MFEDILNSQTVWEKIKNTKLPIVCYGTGNGADKIFDELQNLNICVSAVMASDGFVRNRCFRGFKVKSLNECENEYEKFIVIVCFGSQRTEVIDNIKTLSNKHETLVPTVSVHSNSLFNRNFAEAHIDDLKYAYELLADEKSRKTFLNILNFEFSGELKYLFECECEKDEAFYNILKLKSDESYLDLGAYKGDTINEFLHYTDNNYNNIIAVEPDTKNFKKLTENTVKLKNITLINEGIWDKKSALEFENSGGRNSSIIDNYAQNKVYVNTVDNIVKDKKVTYLKADTEGAEYEMLSGAEKTLQLYKPKLNIAAYHKIEDLYLLPRKIHELNPNYKIFLRHHPYIPAWDTNLYCI